VASTTRSSQLASPPVDASFLYRVSFTRCIILLAALFFASASVSAQQGTLPPPPPPAANTSLYATTGIGFINIDGRGPGVRAPLGFAATFNKQRLILRANVLDLSFLEGNDQDNRYVRSFASFGPSSCIDTQYNSYVADYRCSGGTDLLTSSSIELSYIALNEVWLAGHQGKVFVGGGLRVAKPRGGYGTIGFFFERPYHSSGGVQLMIGKGFVGFGLLWGYDLRRLFN
jgi:hypothetical protein